MFIVREPCLKTERTRKKTLSFNFCLLDKIGLEESIRLLCVALFVCVCLGVTGKRKEPTGRKTVFVLQKINWEKDDSTYFYMP